jgi:hypothetical protein
MASAANMVIIRKATEADIPRLRELYCQLSLDPSAEVRKPAPGDCRRVLRDFGASEDRALLVAEEDGQVVGTATLSSRPAWRTAPRRGRSWNTWSLKKSGAAGASAGSSWNTPSRRPERPAATRSCCAATSSAGTPTASTGHWVSPPPTRASTDIIEREHWNVIPDLIGNPGRNPHPFWIPAFAGMTRRPKP